MRRILVIEDNPVTQLLMSSLLSQAGHEVVGAEDGIQGVEIFDKGGIDLVITDLMMPEQEGLATIRAIRHRNRCVPILAMSGHPQLHERRSYLDMTLAFGANDTIPKPFDLDVLQDKVASLLARAIPAY